MLKRMIKITKKIIASFLILYGYNMLASSLGFIIPINLITIISITIFGIPALLALIFLIVTVF